MNSIKIFLNYFEITLLEQKTNAFDLATTKNKLKALILLKISKTFVKLQTYLKLIDYIKQYIHYYVSLFRSLQNFKTTLLKTEFINDNQRKIYTSKTKLKLTFKKEKSFKELQKAIANSFILIYFDFNRIL